MTIINELQLSKDLIRFPSITPKDAGVIKFLSKKLNKLGFNCKILEFKDKKSKPIKNLYARLGKKRPNLCYAGHTDVVPPGNLKDWTINPFKPSVKKNYLIGRGANDMKSSIACFVAAVSRFLKKNQKFIVYSNKAPKLYKYKIINEYDHDISSYTQGLEFDENQILFESTGQYGYSTLKKINFKNGETIKNIFLDENYFGEGITILNDKIYQLTWLKGIGFIYEKDSFKMIDSFNYNDSLEGWGLCNDGEYLYKSDGSEKIWKLDPNTLEELSNIQVVTNNKVINKINELEWVDGKIYANTYQFNKEVGIIIDPIDGSVDGVIDFSGLKQRVKKHDKLDVLNGIAYNKKTKTFFVTGKYWNKLFEIQIFEN